MTTKSSDSPHGTTNTTRTSLKPQRASLLLTTITKSKPKIAKTDAEGALIKPKKAFDLPDTSSSSDNGSESSMNLDQ